MKKTTLAMTLFSAAILGAGFASNTVFAADEAQTPQTHQYTGEAYVSFSKTTSTGPIDPSDPNNSDPSNGTSDPGVNGLSLDAIPKVLNFGNHDAVQANQAGQSYTLLASAATTETENDAKEGAKTIDGTYAPKTTDASGLIDTQVTNVDAKVTSWTLNAQLSDFVHEDGSTKLAGASIDFGAGTFQTLGTTTADDGTSSLAWLPDSTGVAAFNLPAGDADGVNYYTSSVATGTTQQVWNTDDVKLNTLAPVSMGQYKATITWTLTSTPDGE
ncbi:WxL domain-containing protein [Lacticaseibacillus mingshuiensis]|uniref:WxL domain-containing protein n=1 Tax=Lacticaseibacillus mingshuiensis TaxID=2799574 RepID=A0ABW4CGF0_9LACO|nr:WxL domain-containing protein [Lacticaseibacillus mingshuiensis]